MSDFWKTVLSSVTLSTVASTAMVALLRTWISTRIEKSIKHEYDEKLETHRKNLKAELAGTKAGYKQVLDEHQIRFSHLHAARADAIKELYSRLVEMERKTGAVALILLCPPSGNTPEREKEINQRARESAANSINEFHEYFRKNRILLTSEECDQIEDIHSLACEVCRDAKDGDRFIGEQLPEDAAEKGHLRLQAHNKMKERFPSLRESLENEFRTAIGLTDESPSAPEDKE